MFVNGIVAARRRSTVRLEGWVLAALQEANIEMRRDQPFPPFQLPCAEGLGDLARWSGRAGACLLLCVGSCG